MRDRQRQWNFKTSAIIITKGCPFSYRCSRWLIFHCWRDVAKSLMKNITYYLRTFFLLFLHLDIYPQGGCNCLSFNYLLRHMIQKITKRRKIIRYKKKLISYKLIQGKKHRFICAWLSYYSFVDRVQDCLSQNVPNHIEIEKISKKWKSLFDALTIYLKFFYLTFLNISVFQTDKKQNRYLSETINVIGRKHFN